MILIGCVFITVASVQQQYIFSIQGDRYLQLYLNASNILRCEVGTGGDSWTYSRAGTNALLVGNSYFIRIYYNNGNYKVDISADGSTWTNEITMASASQIITGTHTLLLCSQRSLGTNFTGSIDLKQFSITVGGQEVFSGNKTGIDTIKPDNYTVVGTPTISADGIFTSTTVSKNNYISLSNFTATSNLRAEFEFDVVGGSYGAFILNDTTNLDANGVYINQYGISWNTYGLNNWRGSNFIRAGHSYKFYIQ